MGNEVKFIKCDIMEVMMFPPVFADRMRELGLDVSLYGKYPRKCIHILDNEDEIVSMFRLQPVLWAEHCYWVDDPVKIQDEYYDSIFVQDAGSAVPVLALDVTQNDRVLDLCAAPGSKTLHLVRRAGHVTAVDAHRKRVQRLEYNMVRFHVQNCSILRADGRRLRSPEQVDKVLVDAPCTGEGMVGKIHKVLKLWSVKRIKLMSKTQKQLVLRGLLLVKDGGTLVYSTCTFAPEENEGVVNAVLEKADVELEQIFIPNLQYRSGLTEWHEKEYSPEVKKAIRVNPFHNCTNGFFAAKFRKL